MIRSRSVTITGRLTYREVIEKLWRAQPSLRAEEVRRRTGAPSATVKFVRRQLAAAGVLTNEPWRCVA